LTDYAVLYREARERIGVLVGSVDHAQLATTVPGCPEWSVADTVAHLAALTTEAVSGTLTGIPDEEQTGAQVRRRRGMPIDEVLAEWDGAAGLVEQALTERRMPLAIVHDVITHEADIRGALGAGRPPEQAWTASLHGMTRNLDRLSDQGTLTVRIGERELTTGSGEPVVTLDVDAYEFWRASLVTTAGIGGPRS
jgi:uncharacterized protein (TIGR03083 family)